MVNLLELCKNLQQKIESLEARIEELEAENKALNANYGLADKERAGNRGFFPF